MSDIYFKLFDILIPEFGGDSRIAMSIVDKSAGLLEIEIEPANEDDDTLLRSLVNGSDEWKVEWLNVDEPTDFWPDRRVVAGVRKT